MSEQGTFYITTPIYYPSDRLHIGHSYTTVAADCMARFKRLTGHDVMFLTGTDEHGQKIERRAVENNKEPQEFVDEIVAWIKQLWGTLDISYDDFIRTTESRHKDIVQKIFEQFYEQGDIYKGEYEGWYCTPCEAFWLERQLKPNSTCPDCERQVEWVKEESYFFKMSKYQDLLMEHIENNPEFIQPEARKNEMINNFLKPGLEDLCVSRTTFKWGIEVPMDQKHVIYVWLDALANYITALGYLSDDDAKFKNYWPCDVHLVGKEIVRFHTIYWPIFLMALDLPLPKQVFGHGWLLLQEGKISKSKGNVVDPMALVSRYGADPIRYYLLREIPFGSDGTFTLEALVDRMNYDLANDLGNLLHRTVAMIYKYFDGVIPEPQLEHAPDSPDKELQELSLKTPGLMEKAMDNLDISDALIKLWELVKRTNKYIDETEPWVLKKDPDKQARLGTVLYNLAESLRFISVLTGPYMPRTPDKMWEQLGIKDRQDLHTLDSLSDWGRLPAGVHVNKGEPIFPRLELEEELAVFEASKEEDNDIPETSESSEAETTDDGHAQISINDLEQVELRVGEIMSAEDIKGADKLLKLQVDLGYETRQVVAGIKQGYNAADLLGKKVVLVANLESAKLKGVKSEGMVLAATDENTSDVKLATIDDPNIKKGSRVT